jgi:probable phosphoglycerate mutase
MDFGAWEGMTLAEVENHYPDDLDEWRRSPHAAPTGSVDTFATILDRLSGTARTFATRYAGTAAIAVTHVTPIKPGSTDRRCGLRVG